MFYHLIRLLGLYFGTDERGAELWVSDPAEAYRFPGKASATHWAETLCADLPYEIVPVPYR